MKTIKTTILTLAVTLCTVSSAFAQYTLESRTNRPRPGDQLIKQEVKFKDPGRAGKNVLWDFSQLSYVKKQKTILTRPLESIDLDKEDISSYIKTVNDSETPVIYFAEDSGRIVAVADHGTQAIYRYNASGDSLLIWGYEQPDTRVVNSLPETWMTYPFSFKDKLSSYYAGNGNYCGELDVDVMGSVEVEADAFGMIILPNKDTLENVIRVRTLKTTVDSREPIFIKKNGKQAKVKADSIAQALKLNKKDLLKTEVIRWYAEGYRYPVFETWNSYTDKQGKKSGENLQAFFFHPIDQEEQYLPNDTVNNQIVEKKKKNKNKLKSSIEDQPTAIEENTLLSYNVFPNPTEREIQVEIYLWEETPVRMMLFSLQGNPVYQTPQTTQSGVYRQTIPLQSLPKGQYILRIAYGNKTITEKIIKN